jgi:hypothetical protein
MDYQAALQSHDALTERNAYSRELLARVRGAVAKRTHCSSPSICIFAAGSLGRHETGRISDLDPFLIADRPDRRDGERSLSRLDEISILSELIQLNEELKLPPFSGDGTYLRVQEIRDVVAGTGTATDDSENFFTTRLLLLLESKSIVNDALYLSAVRQIIEMYFRDGKGRKGFRPLFLLNDILRYWRTLCLNYERSRHEPGKPWWKKNLNLKFPRKLTVFSTVLAIIATGVTGRESFESLVPMTPLERLAAALDALADHAYINRFHDFLNDYEDFLAAKSHSELEPAAPVNIARFSEKAERFDQLLHAVLASPRLDQQLVRYISI